jgi:catechol-2,3-dioxygenase
MKVGDAEGCAGQGHWTAMASPSVRFMTTVSQSIYLDDPDGNMVELFVDGDPAIWAANPAAVAQTKPLALG